VLLATLASAPGAARADTSGAIVAAAPEGTPWAELGTREVARQVTERSRGRIKLRVLVGGVAGDEVATAEKCARGEYFAWHGTVGALANVAPGLAALELPFLFRDTSEVDAVMADPEVREAVDAAVSAAGLTRTAMIEVGWRHFVARKPLLSPDDFAGLQVRSQPSPLHQRMWQLLGARARPISVNETLGALQAGVVHGLDNSAVFLFAASWYQSLSVLTLSSHMYQPAIGVLCKGVAARLGRADVAMFREVTRVLTPQVIREVRRLEGEVLEALRREGMTLVELSPAQRERLATVTHATHAWFRSTTDARGRRLLAAIEKVLRRLRTPDAR
jgi:TRAP-type C4-dicarboxylate transport system substrate-binding protein